MENRFGFIDENLKRITFNINETVAKYRNPDQNPYDTLLSDYEPGVTQDILDNFFNYIKKPVTELVDKIKRYKKCMVSTICII